MILLDNLKPLKIYKRPLFLPTMEDDKKKKSVIYLLTPNYESSKALMTSPMLINRLRFASYYIEKDLTYFISSKVMNKVDDVTESYVRNFTESDIYHSLCEMSTAERNKLKDSDFGLPNQRKYLLDSREHIKSAIKFFNYVNKKDEKELAENINKAIPKFFDSGEYPPVGKNNRFKKYYKIQESILQEGYVKNVKDIYYNKDKFDSGEINLCFITGHSGSGKSTMGYKLMNDDKKLETYGLDDIIANWSYSDDNLKQYGDMISSFFKGPGKKFRYHSKQDWLDDKAWDNKDEYVDGYEISVITAFVKYAITYSKAHKDKKFVLEGVWIFHFIDPSDIDDFAVYIKGTSALISKYRASKRDTGDAETKLDKIRAFGKNMSQNWKNYFMDEKKVQKYCNYFSKKVISESVITETCKDIETARKFVWDVSKLAKKYNANYFIVTDGASGTSNNGNPAVKHARDCQIEWEKKHGFDPDEDWSDTMKESVLYENNIDLSSLKVINNPDKKFVEDHIDNASCIKDFLHDSIRKNSCMFLDTKTNKIACVFMVFNDGGHKIINNFEVTPEYRGKGLSKQLLDYAVKKKGADHLWVNDDNTIAKNLYLKYGFKPTGDKQVDGKHTRLYMALESINESYEIQSERGFYHNDGTYNCIVQVNGEEKPLRGRGEILIIDPTCTKIYLVFNKDGTYKIPGGGFEPNETNLDATIREAKEEARLIVTAAYDTGVRYVEMFKDDIDKTQADFAPENRFYGFYTEVFVGTATGAYNGELDTVDVDEFMTTGKFYDIEEVYDKLIPEHKKALNSTITESTDINLSNFNAYHLEPVRKGFNPKSDSKCWDEELYYKDIKMAISNDICSSKNIEYPIEAHVYTMGDDCTAIYLGIITIYNGETCDWEWSEQEDISPSLYSYIKDEVQREENLNWVSCKEFPGYQVLHYSDDNKGETEVFYDEEYSGKITENDITYSGFLDDLKILRRVATPETYNDILDSLKLDFKVIPKLNFIACDKEDIEIVGNEINIYVYSNRSDLSEDEYICMVLYNAIMGLIWFKYPNLKNTIFPRLVSDMLIYNSNYHSEFIDNNPNEYSLKDMLDSLNSVDTSEMFKIAKKYNIDKIESVDDIVQESSKEITAKSLTNKLKYRTTKTKIANSKLKNKVVKLADSIKSNTTSSTKEEEPTQISESMISALSEGSYIIAGDYVTIFEDATYDPMLKKVLYTERMVKRKEVVALLNRVKTDIPEIKYAYTDLSRYAQKNLFVDLYYYNQAFFKNNIWKQRKGFNLYLELLDRLINDKRINAAGYKRKTVFISINDWYNNPSTKMWLYREELNPISIIYDLMIKDPNRLSKLFKNVSVVFFGNDKYFTIDFNDTSNMRRNAIKFKNFIVKINKGEEFGPEDSDTTEDAPTKDAIKADIMDKIELSKGVDLTPAAAEVKKDIDNKKSDLSLINRSSTKPEESEEEQPKVDKLTANSSIARDNTTTDKEVLKTVVKHIDNAVNNATDTEDALDNMDDDIDMKELLSGLDSMKDDAVNINAARAERMSQLDKELLDKSVKGRSIRNILDEDKSKEKTELPVTSLPVASPNEEWKHLQYMNYDKTYDLEKDIVNIFKFFGEVSRPLSIRNIKVEDNSTSEDRLDLYIVEYEDYRGKRFTIKLDIPRIKNQRFLLRGNLKQIQTQFFNMPIIKTDLDTCQIVTNYKKIIITRFNTASGRSLPNVNRFIKAANKYQGKKIKFIGGDNSRVCAKYILPIDYVDLSSVFTTIENDKYIVYFNQDEIRKQYTVNEGLGVPYAIDKAKKEIIYYPNNETITFIDVLVGLLIPDPNSKDKEFFELFSSIKATPRNTYTRAKIMSSEIPLVIVCAYSEGLTKVMKKANITHRLVDKLTSADRTNLNADWIRFNDGYLIYDVDYNSSLLLSGLKDCDTLGHSITEIDDKNMYLEFLDGFGGRIKADGLDNFYDCEIDPITKETLEFYKLPTDYISVLLYANYLLSDNKFIRHTDTCSRRARRYELIAAYTYQVMSETYGVFANSLKHNRTSTPFSCKQSAVIDKIMLDPTSGDYSVNNLLNDVETTNAITYKGLSGMNSDRSYSLDKRTFDKSMLGVIGMSTGFSGNVGITRQATLDMGIEGGRGYIKDNKGKIDNLNTAKVLTATESVMPMMTTHDDPMRVAMSFIQTSKHAVRTEESDPLLVTSGADEALAYICSDQFAHKAKAKGVIKDLNESEMIIQYEDGSKEFINLRETIEKNSDGGFYVPLKLSADPKLKIGSKIKPGQIVAYDRLSLSNSVGESDNLAYNVGKLAKVAIINTDEGFEDSGVITEEMARKLACRIIGKADCILDKDTNIFNVVKVGQEIEQGDPLLIWQTPYDEEEVNALLKALANDKEALSELGRHTVKSEVTGRVAGIKIYRTTEITELSDSLKKLVKQYERPIGELKNKLADEGIEFSDLPANYPLDATGKLKKAYDSILIEFYIEYTDILGVGDKITYNAANKAIISKVIPEDKEPTTDLRPNEPISAFVSVTSIQKRMVQSTVTYGSLQKLMIELDRTCKDMAGIPYDDTEV